ncbi:MAG: hypothetical protein IJ562_11750 [Prevotella sp.]|nr:hypothetical protein [Prevotella sp.]
MRINTFYTWFWILYIPLCILFYHRVNDYVDEFMTLALAIFTLTKLGKRKSAKAQKEVLVYTALMLVYFMYSVFIRINTTNALLLDFQQQVRPYVVFYCTYLLAPSFTKWQQNFMMRMLAGIVVLYFLTNSYVLTSGLQGQETTPVIGQASLLIAMLYLFCYGDTGERKWVALIIVSLGLLSGKSKFFGEYVAFVGVFFFLKNKLNLKSATSIFQLATLTLLVVIFTWTKFNAYYVEGFEHEEARQMNARPASYTVAGDIIFRDYVPLGSGLASFGTNAAAVHYSPLYHDYNLDKIWGLTPGNPMFLADAFYPTLAQFGLVGIFFFLWFWARRYNEVAGKKQRVYYKVGLMCILALALESVADTSYLSGKGMGYFMLLAMCIRFGDSGNRKKRRIIIVNRDVAEKGNDRKEKSDENLGR